MCGRAVDISALAYSDAARGFVCPTCRAAVGENDLTRLADARHQAAARPPSSTSHAAPGTPWRWVAGLVVAAVGVTALVILLVGRPGKGPDPRRQWEDANRDRIIALKSEAEALTIKRKLPEAHAKYRELEKLIGGRTIQDPRLFDLVDQARLDQSRVYTMILHAMSPQAVEKQPLPTPLDPAGLTASGLPGAVDAVPQTQQTLAVKSQPFEPRPATSPQAVVVDKVTTAPRPASAPVPTPAEAAAAPPPSAPAVARRVSYTPVTDAQVDQAIRRGVDFLIGQFENGKLRKLKDSGGLEYEGLNALAVYALVQASTAISEPRLGQKGEFLSQCLDALRGASLDSNGQINGPATYAHSLRASALATFNRPQDRQALEADVKWLINAEVDGAYTYDDAWTRQNRKPPRQSRAAPPHDPLPGLPAEYRVPPARSRTQRQGFARPLGLAGGAELVLMHNGEVLPGVPLRPPIPPRPIYQPPPRGYRDNLPKYEIPERVVPFPWDNSNSQYGVLGVWAGAEVGVEVSDSYWKAVRDHWIRCQLPSGQWSYTPRHDASYSMTVGGIASLLVTHDYLDAPMLGGTRTAGRKPYDDFLTAALAHLEDGDNVMDYLQTAPDTMLLAGYNLFGLERVGLASGLKYFGAHDWYAEFAARLMPTQWPNGAWGRSNEGKQAIIDTSYMLLFLSRGRHPVIMNKLKFEGFWTNRPRDLANLAAYAGREMERPLNWQVVDIARPADDWADAPIAYLASHRPLELEEEQIRHLREFVEAGGLLFTHADLGSESFNTWAAGLAKRLFPGSALENLSPQHPIYSLNYKLPTPRVRFQGVDNGVRLLMVHSPTDLSNAWQVRATISRKEAFQLPVNLYLYTTGKEQFRNRLDTRAVPPPGPEPAPQLDVAQVVYDGDWNPEPGAWKRFAMKFQARTGKRLHVLAAKPAELSVESQILAILTGVEGKTPTDADLAPIAAFVRDGGVLLVDSCGGSGAFANAIQAWLGRLDQAARLEPLPQNDPASVHTIEGTVDLPREQLRLYALEQIGGGTRMKAMKIGEGRVFFTPLDLTSGLLGTNTWGILGYSPEYAEALVSNIILTTSAAAK